LGGGNASPPFVSLIFIMRALSRAGLERKAPDWGFYKRSKRLGWTQFYILISGYH